jgi:hypothetical protein
MDVTVFKVTQCSREENRFDVMLRGGYDTFLDAVTEHGNVEVLSRTPYLAVLTYEEGRVAVERNRDVEDRFTVTVTAENKAEAITVVRDVTVDTDVNLKR